MIDILRRHLRNIVVLTVQAAEVAARTGQRQARRTRMEMVQWLLLNGVDGQRTRLAIHLAHEHAPLIPPTTAHPRLALSNTAMVRTERALHPSILQPLIIPTLHHRHIFLFRKLSLRKHRVRRRASHPIPVQPCPASNVPRTPPSSSSPRRPLAAGTCRCGNPS